MGTTLIRIILLLTLSLFRRRSFLGLSVLMPSISLIFFRLILKLLNSIIHLILFCIFIHFLELCNFHLTCIVYLRRNRSSTFQFCYDQVNTNTYQYTSRSADQSKYYSAHCLLCCSFLTSKIDQIISIFTSLAFVFTDT